MSLWQCHELDLVPLTLDLYGGSSIMTLASWIVRPSLWLSKGLNLLIFSSWLLHDNFMTTSGWLKDDSESPQRSLRALRKHSESTQKAIRENSESTQKALRERLGLETGIGEWEMGKGQWKQRVPQSKEMIVLSHGPPTIHNFYHEGVLWQQSVFSKNVSGWSPLPIKHKKLPEGERQ